MKIKAMICMVLCLALSVCMMTGCEVVDLNTALTVDGVEITAGEFNFFMDMHKSMIADEMNFNAEDENAWKTMEIDNRKAIDVAKDNAINEIVSLWVQAKKAQDEGIVLSAEDIAAVEENYLYLVESYGGTEAFNKKLAKWEVSKESVKEIIKKYAYASMLREKYVTTDPELNNITEEELRAQYDSEMSMYVTVKHILIMYDNEAGGITRTKEEAKALGEEILAKLEKGEDFDKLMRAHSDDSPESFDNGYTFVHGAGEMVTPFDDAAYALEVGEVSGMVEVEEHYKGFHIIKRLPTETGDTMPFELVSESLKMSIANDRYSALLEDTWIANANVVKNAKILDKLN